MYQLQLYEDKFALLCITWQKKVWIILSNKTSNSWDPSLEQLQVAINYEYTLEAYDDNINTVEDENNLEIEQSDEEDQNEAEFLEAYELAALQDQFNNNTEDTIMELQSLSSIKRGHRN